MFSTLLSLARTSRRINGCRIGVGVLTHITQLSMGHENQSNPACGQSEKDSQEK
jgi:hypothetical protein